MLEWNNVGQFRGPPRSKFQFARANAFQSSVREQEFPSERVRITRVDQTFVPSTLAKKSLVQAALSYLNSNRPSSPPELPRSVEFFVNDVLQYRGWATDMHLQHVLRILFGVRPISLSPARFNARIYPGLRGPGPLEWNSLGAPIQLVQGHRYMSRWLAELAPATGCGDILSSVQQVISQASAQPTWPWQGLVASGAPSSGFPAGMGNFPFTTPGFCPIWLEGVWKNPTTPTIDSKDLPGLPGFFNTDFFDYTTQQQLVEVPRAPVGPTGPCNPADLAFDPVSGIFKCAGQIIITPTTPPQTPNPCTDGQARRADGTCPPPVIPSQPPVDIGTQEKKEKSVVPWLIGGALLIGGGVLLAKAG